MNDSAVDPSHLYLQLLGEVQLLWAGQSVPLPGPKPLALLVYLHLNGETSRDELAEVFWPTKANAHQNVRQALTTLRRLGGAGDWLVEGRDGTSFTLNAISDVSELRRLHEGSDCEAVLPLVLGTGVLLERVAPPSAVFESWLEEERRNLRAVQLSVLHTCGLNFLDAGEFDRARDLLRQVLLMEPLGDSEAIYRALMLLEHRAGRTAQALEVFEECRRTLESELGLEPDGETLELLQLIENRQSGANQRGQLLNAAVFAVPDEEPFLGRAAEVQSLQVQFQEHRRVLLQGLAGLGKTRVARETARQFAGQNGQVVWLEVGGDAAGVIAAGLRDLLRVPPGGDLNAALKQANVTLLVLDNAMNTYAAQQVLNVLPEGLPVLVTSRLRLPGLVRVELTRLKRDAALELLKFHLPDSADALNLDALCSLLGDHPFALRLAARTLGSAPGADVLRALYDAPQDTIRALLEQSVTQCTPREYEVYLAVGSLPAPQSTPELLTCLLERPAPEIEQALFQLVDRGLLTRESRAGSDTLSFRMHDLTWHAAREHRAHLPQHVAQAVTRYARHYTHQPDLLATDLPHLLGASEQTELLPELMKGWLGGQYIAARGFPTAHLHRLQSAIHAAETTGDWDTASVLNGKYADIHQALLGDQSTAIQRLLRAAQQAEQTGNRGRQATFLALAGQMQAMKGEQAAFQHLQAAQALADESGDALVQARVRAQLAQAHAFRQEFTQAHALLLEAQSTLETLLHSGNSDRATWTAYLGVLSNLGQAKYRLGNLHEALALKEQVGQIAAGRDERLFMARSAFDQGELLHLLGQPQDAMTQLKHAIELSQVIGSGSLESMARQLLQNIASTQ